MASNILLVEYEQRYIDQIRGALADSGARIEVAGDLDRAVDICAHFEPRLVIITSVLPRIEISDAITQLRARAGLRITPFLILMSGYGGGDPGADAAGYGAQGLIERPFTGEALAERVGQLLAAAPEVGATQAIPQETLDAVQQHAGEVDGGESLTSDELFGDIVSDVERDADEKAPVPPVSAPPPVVPVKKIPRPVEPAQVPPKDQVEEEESPLEDAVPKEDTSAVVSPPAEDLAPGQPAGKADEPVPPKRRSFDASVDEEIEQVLADVLKDSTESLPIRRPASVERDVDAMLSETLSGLELEKVGLRREAAPQPPPELPELESEVAEAQAAEPEPIEEALTPVPDEGEVVEVLEIEPLDGEAEGEVVAEEVDAPSPAVEPGTQFGQYVLEAHIATGGMAEVYRARMVGMEGFQKTVAIKRILSQLTGNEEFVTMLIDEAKLAAQLNHNNIIHIYDLGKIDQSYFIAMEYIEGKDLRALLQEFRERGVRMPIPLALHIAGLLASALDHAHKKRDFDNQELGLVHRDVSPQNVLISDEGDVKLCDFGIAKAASKATTTRAGALKGKLQYMSPEQAWGKDIDHRSDIFSLGLVLYEMLTCRKAFSGTSERSILEQVRDPKVSAPSKLNAEVSSDVDRIVLKALEPQLEQRYQSARELQGDLEAVMKAEGWAPDNAAVARLVQDPASAALIEVPVVDAGAEVVAEDATVPVAPIAAEIEPPAVDEMVPGLETEPGVSAPAVPRSRRPVWLLAGGAVLIAVASGLVYIFSGGSREGPPTPTPVPMIVVPTRPQPTPTPTDEDLRDRVSELAAAEVARREDDLRRRLEEEFPTPTPLPPTETPVPTDTPTETPVPTDTPTETPVPPTATPIPSTPTPSVREGEIVTIGPGVIPPVVIHRVPPEYPRIALRQRIEGVVEAEALVGPDGRVEEVRILEVSHGGVGFDEATEEAVLQWRYKPATKHGVKVRTWVQIHVPFQYGND